MITVIIWINFAHFICALQQFRNSDPYRCLRVFVGTCTCILRFSLLFRKCNIYSFCLAVFTSLVNIRKSSILSHRKFLLFLTGSIPKPIPFHAAFFITVGISSFRFCQMKATRITGNGKGPNRRILRIAVFRKIILPVLTRTVISKSMSRILQQMIHGTALCNTNQLVLSEKQICFLRIRLRGIDIQKMEDCLNCCKTHAGHSIRY